MTIIRWPAVIKYTNDAELLFINSQDEWANDIAQPTTAFEPSDYLLDSTGNVFSLTIGLNHTVLTRFSNKTMSLDEVLGIVKAHAAQAGSCCVAKLYAPSIEEAFKMVKALSH